MAWTEEGRKHAEHTRRKRQAEHDAMVLADGDLARLREAGASWRVIARYFELRGLESPSGPPSKWSGSAVERIARRAGLI